MAVLTGLSNPLHLASLKFFSHIVVATGTVGNDCSLKRFVRVVAVNTLHILVRACQEFVVLLMMPDKTPTRGNLILVSPNVTLSAKGGGFVFLNISLSLGRGGISSQDNSTNS